MTQHLESSRKPSRRWEYAIGILALILMIGLGILIARNWHDTEQIASYGLAGGFLLSLLGGGTVPVPVPVTAVYFALGGLLKPWFGPAVLGPALIGVVCGLGEALGSLSTYATGYSGAVALKHREERANPSRLDRLYRRLMRMMNRRGGWALFGVSAIINPFFYPIALTAGISRFGAKRFFFICFAGKAVKCTAIAYVGYLGLQGLLGIGL